MSVFGPLSGKSKYVQIKIGASNSQFHCFLAVIVHYIIFSDGVSFKRNGPHNPAETSPVVFGENSSENIFTDTELPNCSSSRIAVVVPITPAPIIAIFFTELILNGLSISNFLARMTKKCYCTCPVTDFLIHFLALIRCNQTLLSYLFYCSALKYRLAFYYMVVGFHSV